MEYNDVIEQNVVKRVRLYYKIDTSHYIQK